MSSLEDSVKHIVQDEVDEYLNSSGGYLEMFESLENRIIILQKRVRKLELLNPIDNDGNYLVTENKDE